MPCAACTIVSPNYLAYARTVAASYLEHHPGHRFFVLIVANLTDSSPFAEQPFETILLGDLPIPNLHSVALKYDILELNTNVKPTFMRYLIAKYRLDTLVYLDPDIFVYAPLAPIFEALEASDAVLTPHITSPIHDDLQPNEQEMLYNGTYNLGFIAVNGTSNADAILSWWERRCLDLGFSEGRTGLFVDQKWMNLAPALFDRVRILRHPGCNMAYWNLHERTLLTGRVPQEHATESNVFVGAIPSVTADPVSLIFFHFSGLELHDPANLSRNTNRFSLATRPDLTTLFAAYKSAVLANADPTLESIPYGFDTFSDGTAINRLTRRLYAGNLQHFPEAACFAATGAFFRFARANHLLAGKALPPKAGWQQFSATDRRVEAVHGLLRFALRILGPNRYDMLMRYLAHITVLRHQAVFLKPAPSGKDRAR